LYQDSGLHIFVDSLPNDKNEVTLQKTVQALIGQNLPFYQIIEKLRKAGATVCGTENVELLLQEYEYWQGIAQGQKTDKALVQWLLEERDKAIARRINEVLQEGGKGIIFIGAQHRLTPELDGFRIIHLL